MKVFDVVQTVTGQGKQNSSYPAGSWIVTHSGSRSLAATLAEVYTGTCHTPGIAYTVEEHDELSPERKMDYRDYLDLVNGRKNTNIGYYHPTAIARSRMEIA